MPPNKRPSKKTSKTASKVLRRKNSGKGAKTAAGYTLGDTPSGRGATKRVGRAAAGREREGLGEPSSRRRLAAMSTLPRRARRLMELTAPWSARSMCRPIFPSTSMTLFSAVSVDARGSRSERITSFRMPRARRDGEGGIMQTDALCIPGVAEIVSALAGGWYSRLTVLD